MFNKLINTYFCICVALRPSFSESDKNFLRQKMILSLSNELFIKNILIIKDPSFLLNSKTISFTKTLSRSNIYTSFPTAEEIKLIMINYDSPRTVYLKSLVLTFEEEHNDEVVELITENKMAAPKFLWLVWSTIDQTTQKNNFYISYNTQLLIVEDDTWPNNDISYISEIYHPSLNSRVLFERHFGIWSKNKGIEILERDLYKRRINMNGTELKILYAEDSQFNIWMDAVKFILKPMNFRIIFIYANDGLRGETYPEYDIALRDSIFDHKALTLEQVLGLMWPELAHMYIRYEEILEDHGIFAYLRPFPKKLWYSILIVIGATAVCSLIIAWKSIPNFSFLSACYHPLEAFMNQYGSEKPKSTAIRITIITARLLALTIVPAYSAFLTTYILSPNIKLPFTDIESFVQDGSYELGFSHQSNFHDWFYLSEDISLRTAYQEHFLKSYEIPKTDSDTLRKICYYEKVSFVIFEYLAPFIQCKVIKIPTPITTGWNGVILNDETPYKTIFNRRLKMILSAGILNKYDNLEFFMHLRSKKPYDTNDDNSVKIENVKPVFRLLSMLYSLAIIILIFELLYRRLLLRFQKLSFILFRRRIRPAVAN